MVTAPVHKGIINDAGITFTGHTEFLAARSGGHPVMMLACPDCGSHSPPHTCRCARWPMRSHRRSWSVSFACWMPSCVRGLRSTGRGYWSADSTRMPARAVTWVAKRSR